VVGYKKIKFYTHENAGYGDVRLPEMQMYTTAFWFTAPERVIVRSPSGRAAAIVGMRGIGVAFETVAALALMCDSRDLGTTLGDTPVEGDGEHEVPHRGPGGFRPGFNPTLFVYEHVPGGTGLAERIWELRDVLLARTLRLIETCPCGDGCPTCVGPGDSLRKEMATELLRTVVPTA
jgi:DEAD/DEAH box helicase domain-containing protein